ncbi:hypothetical protein LZQ00_04830 [Sphingobacterium sp. SRCM116780]|uniref:hypothetical protein n=1 Tax=Sphingobacterium sp. SRCM116780 TaxID=2907623 RepID=UPI001F3E62AB|nr:hypothetical protein [Sphingobacterium sp. SRCM116780]UIR57140.1 hypothetical protein LZQ00_04830 [Sphingobacterium sp. SRCM116780]
MNFLNRIIVFSFLFALFHVGYAQDNKPIFKSQKALGAIENKELDELSGILNAKQASYFWVHNDSGDRARIFLIDKKCRLRCTYELDAVKVVDCEDIARIEIDKKSFLILADIGDNLAVRRNVKLYIFPEPEYKEGDASTIHIAQEQIRTITLKYKDGSRDAEALFVDPIDQQLYIISKRDFQSIVYKTSDFNPLKNNYVTLVPTQKLPFTFATAADISPSGNAIIIKNLTAIFYWERNPNESVLQTLAKKTTVIPYDPEPQGEAITFDRDGTGFYTISESPFGLKSYLYFFEKQ